MDLVRLAQKCSPIGTDDFNRQTYVRPIGASGDGRQEARFRLYDVNKQSALVLAVRDPKNETAFPSTSPRQIGLFENTTT